MFAKRRGGKKQQAKEAAVWEYHRDPGRGASGFGVTLMERQGWEMGKGLGNGQGRDGQPWGVKGHWVEYECQEVVDQLVWQWTFTSVEAAQYAFQLAGLTLNQVIFNFHYCSHLAFRSTVIFLPHLYTQPV